MADNLVINKVTYPEVEAIAATNEEGDTTMYYADAVRYNPQELQDEQKAQARDNIGAASQADLEKQAEEIADQQTAIEELQEALRLNPILGSIDENNNIILVGTLADGEYTLKYENGDEYIEIGTLVVGEGEPIEAPDTTLTLEAGLKIDSSTGAETTGNAGYSASNYIEIVDGFTYTVYKKSSISEGLKICYYDANKNFMSTSSDVIVSTASQTSAVIPLIDGASFFRLRIYGTASLLDEANWEVTAEVSA